MKKSIFLTIFCAIACIAFLLLPVNTYAADVTASGSCGDDATWTLYSDGTLQISGSGATRGFPWRSYKDSITRIFVGEGITYIDDYAFNGCSNLEAANLPETMIGIGYNAFSSCGKLSAVGSWYTKYLPNSIESIGAGAFQNCSYLSHIILSPILDAIEDDTFSSSGVTAIVIPGTAGTIGQRAFFNCSRLEKVTIQEGTTSIGLKAFAQCAKLQSVDIPASVTEIGKEAFSACEMLTDVYYNGTEEDWNNISIDNSGEGNFANAAIHFIEEGAYVASGSCSENLTWTLDSDGELTISGSGRMTDFRNSASWLVTPAPWEAYNEQITRITIQEGVESIGGYAFSGCSNLLDVSISNSVTGIGPYAFSRCSSLISISIPESVMKIDYAAFNMCEKLENVNIPNAVTGIGSQLFYKCSSLSSIDIPNGVTYIGSYAFAQCDELVDVVIPDSVTSIKDHAFYQCKKLESINIPCRVAEIEDYTFYGCSQLSDVDISNRVTSIGQDAFAYCNSLVSIVIPDSVIEIKSGAFWCDNLSDVYYIGSENEWEAISIGANNKGLDQAIIHFDYPSGITEAQYVVFYTDYEMVFQTSSKAIENKTIDEVYLLDYTENTPIWDGYPYYLVKKVTFAAPVTPPTTEYWFDGFEQLQTIEGIDNLDTSNVKDMSYMFNSCRALTTLDVSSLDTSNVTDMGHMFSGCNSLTSLDVSGFDTSNVTNMATMFSGCNSLISLDVSGFNTSNVKSMGSMFSSCSSLTSLDVSRFDTSSITNMIGMFSGCTGLTTLDIRTFDTSNVTNTSRMFSGCTGLTTLDMSGFNTSNVTNMYYMFYGCSSLTTLDVSRFDTGNVTSMGSMFSGCSSLTTLDVSRFDTSNVTSIYNMFSNCSSLTSLDVSGFETGNVTNMEYMFKGCDSLRTLDVSGFDTSKVTRMRSMFDGCGSLSTIYAEDSFSVCDDSVNMFSGCTSLVGGSGTPFDANYVDGTYARIDTTETPGYFTRKAPAAQYVVVYVDNEMIFQASENSVDGRSIIATYPLDYDGTTPPWSASANTVTKVTFADPVAPSTTAKWFSGFSKLQTIEGIDKLDTSNVTDMSNMFLNCDKLTSLDVSGFDTSNVTNMSSMFESCYALTSLDVSGFDTGSVTNMSFMFSSCNSLTSLDVSGFDTGNVTNMAGMFESCFALTSLDVSGFDTSNVTDMNMMFKGCSTLTSLDVSNFDTGNVTDMADMFEDCSSLTALDLSGFDTSNVGLMPYMFTNCKALTWLDISSFNTGNVTGMFCMFGSCSQLTTIYAGTGFVVGSSSSYMFSDCTKLVGGNGTTYDGSHVDGTYAKIDSLNEKGYFSDHHVLTAVSAVPATCESAGAEGYWTCNVCGCFFADENGLNKIGQPVVIPATGHDWAEITYTWSEDNDKVTALKACNNDHAHDITETVDTVLTVKTAATCEADGSGVYVAAFTNQELFETQIKDAVIPATGHDWSAVAYTWADDNSTVTAAKTCSNDPEHIVSETVETLCTVITSATCESAGRKVYSATFTNPEFEPQAKDVEIPAGHTLSKIAATAADCVTAGNSEYWTCSACGKFFSDAEGTNEIAENSWVIPALGHDLTAHEAKPASCGTAGNIACWTCTTCGRHFGDAEGKTPVSNFEIPATGHALTHHPEVTADCETPGNIAYWSCSNCGKFFSDEACTQEIRENDWVIKATDHEWTITYTWETDYSQVTARKACQNNSSHDMTETVTPAYEIAIAPGCLTAGKGRYTATFENASFTAQINEIDLPATGHALTHHPEVAVDCETPGNIAYWSCSNCGQFFSDEACTHEIGENSWVIPAKGHAWGMTTYTWADDNSTVTASKPCANDHAHDVTETVAATFATVIAPQCGASGNGIYVAEFENDLFETQTKKVVIPATGHTLTKTEAAAAGCETAGHSAYWTCSNCGKYFSDAGGMKEIEAGSWVTPATDHSYKLTGWTWAEDHETAVALFTCEHDESHTVEVEASLEKGTIVTDDSIVARKHTDVEKPYTATVTGPDKEPYEDTITVTLKATHKVHEKKAAKDGSSVELDVKTDTLEITVAGEAVSGAAPVLVASYDEDGRFLGLEALTGQTEKPVEPIDGAESVKIFWVNVKDDTPRCDAEEIERQAE